MRTATYSQTEVLALVREMRPGSDPVAADHDSMAAFCDGEPWFVFFRSEDATPERIILEPRQRLGRGLSDDTCDLCRQGIDSQKGENMRLPRWTQIDDDKEYLIIVVPEEWAGSWSAALSYARYEGREWVVRRGNWLVGCEPGHAYCAPAFDDVEAPEWAFDTV
jgi:hypothetical protein